MSKQILIIGMGQFGMSLAKSLSEKGIEIIAVDINKERIDEAAAFADDAICLDATDESSLANLLPAQRDMVICAIGAREPSILTTALLKQMGCNNITARATDKIHERILKAVGANSVINPDAEYGKKFAYKIMYQNIITQDTSEDIQLTEIHVQPFMENKNLIELALPNKYGIIIAAIKRDGAIIRPFPEEKLKLTDTLLLVCNEDAISKMIEENK